MVLVVDDHADSRELMAAVLSEVGLAIAEAGSGREAMMRLAAPPLPALILVDLTLPDCYGTDIVYALKSNQATSEIPVVALSASVMAADKERAAQAGCAAFIEKPVLPDDVIRIVRRALGTAGA